MATPNQSKAKDDALTFEIEGKTYRFEDFSLGDIEWLEDELGPLAEIDFAATKTTVRFVAVIRRMDNPALSWSEALEEARSVKLAVVDQTETENGSRPTQARKGKRGAAGSRRSPASA